MAGKHNITIDAGTDFFLPIRYTEGGFPVDLSTATLTGGLLKPGDTTPAQVFTFSIVDSAGGQFTASLSDTLTIDRANSRYFVDVTIGQTTVRLLNGSVKLVNRGGV